MNNDVGEYRRSGADRADRLVVLGGGEIDSAVRGLVRNRIIGACWGEYSRTRSNRGDEYQIAVALDWVINLIADESIEFVQVDTVTLPGETDAVAIDDVVVAWKSGKKTFIQAKKNQPNRKEWSLADAVLRDELIKARDQLEQNDNNAIEFVSRTPFGELEKLLEDAADFSHYAAFQENAPQTLLTPLQALADLWERDPEATYSLISRIHIGPQHDFDGWERVNRERLSGLFSDADLTMATLEKLIRSSQSSLGGIPSTLTRGTVLDALSEKGLFQSSDYGEKCILQAFAEASAIGRNWPRTIADESIPRPELSQLLTWIDEGAEGTILLTDGPGTGKTCLLLDLVDRIERNPELGLLFIKGDRFAECQSERELAQAGLPDDIVGMTSRLAGDRKVVVVLDSLDVLSIQREHGSLRLFLRLLDRLAKLRNVTVVVACRAFDLDYDSRLSTRTWDRKLVLQPLHFETVVAPLLLRQGIPFENMEVPLKQLLSTPQNLRLYVDIEKKYPSGDDGGQIASVHELHERYLTEMVIKQPDLGQEAIALLESMSERMLKRRRMSFAWAEVQSKEPFVRRLLSQGIIIEASVGTLQFSHQTLLDTLAVRSAMTRGDDLSRFILAYPPFPFVRPIVRNFVLYIRVHLPTEFSRQIRGALNNDEVAYHLKRVIVETFSEILPRVADHRLVRFLSQNHPDLFHRLIWRVEGDEWFKLLYHHWWPTLTSTTDDNNQCIQFLNWLDRWMNDFPNEVVGLWHSALKQEWGRNGGIAWRIAIDLEKFSHWDIDGIEAFLETLYENTPEKDNFFGKAISRYVDETGNGEELLWCFIAGRVLEEDVSRYTVDQKLRVHSHHFCRDGFLPELLAKSKTFLIKVLQEIERWSAAEKRWHSETWIRDAFLWQTSWDDIHSSQDMRHVDDLRLLFDMVEAELKLHSAVQDQWWCENEPVLRKSREMALRYLLVEAYKENVAGNTEGIAEQLLEHEFFRYSSLEYEMGELANLAYPYIDPVLQEGHQSMLLSLYDDEEWGEKGMPLWASQRIYDSLRWIPASYRGRGALTYIENWRRVFGEERADPDIRSSGGLVSPPMSVAGFMALKDGGAMGLLRHYEGYIGWDDRSEGGLIGDREQVRNLLSDAASLDPLRYASLFYRVLNKTDYHRYLHSIIDGIGSTCDIGLVTPAHRTTSGSHWNPYRMERAWLVCCSICWSDIL